MSPLIAIVGSASQQREYDPPLVDGEVVTLAAESLGRELAKSGFRLAVFSSSVKFIEGDVVRGYISSARLEARSIQVHGRFGKDVEFSEVETSRDIFDLRVDPGDDWEIGYYRTLLSADGLLIVGGGRSAFNAGLIAISREIPILATASLGGAAQRVWRRLPGVHSLLQDEDLSAMAEPWHADSASTLVASLRRQCDQAAERLRRTEREVRKATREVTVGLALGFALLLLALSAIPISYAQPPGTALGIAALVIAPLLAAGCGAIMRNVFDDATRWGRAAVLGAAAGVVTALLFLAAQLTTTPDILTSDSSRRLLFFVLPVGFISGVTFDAVYTRFRSQDVSFTSTLSQSPGP
ncbi:hypothetical protein [Microbispora rosea]